MSPLPVFDSRCTMSQSCAWWLKTCARSWEGARNADGHWWAFSYWYRFYPLTDRVMGRPLVAGVAGSLPQVAVGWPFGWSDQDCKLDRHGAAISHWDLGSPAPGLKCQSLRVKCLQHLVTWCGENGEIHSKVDNGDVRQKDLTSEAVSLLFVHLKAFSLDWEEAC